MSVNGHGGTISEPRRLLIIGLLAVAVYGFFWPAITGDLQSFLIPWLDRILERGPIGAFSEPFSNYTPPYLYFLAAASPLNGALGKAGLIKALSVAATVLLAFAVRHLLERTGAGRRTEAMLWLALIPTVAINASGLGQCDALWSAACIMAVASAIARKPVAMLVWFGVGISFKAQAAFIAPFIAQRLTVERTPAVLWPIPLIVYVVAMLPAALAGWPLVDLFTVYLRQAAWNPGFISNATNPWSVLEYAAPSASLGWLWLGHAAAAAAAITFVIAFRRVDGPSSRIVVLALLSAMLMPFLLPKMHERFFFLADVLAFVLLAIRRDRRSIVIFLLVEGASLAALAGLLFALPIAPAGGALMLTIPMALLLLELRSSVGVEAAEAGRMIVADDLNERDSIPSALTGEGNFPVATAMRPRSMAG